MSLKTKIKDAQEKLDAKRVELKKVFDEAGPDVDMSNVTSIDGDSSEKVEWIRQANAEIEDIKGELEEHREVERGAKFAAETGERGDDRPADDPPSERQSLGEAFVNSAAFLERTGSVGPEASLDVDLRNTLFETGAGWEPESTRTGVVSTFPTRPAPVVVDFFPQIPTGQSSIKYMEETTYTSTNVVEKAEGATFGEPVLELTERTQPVEKIPAWLPVTDEQLEDVEGAQAYVESRLTLMLRQRLDLQSLQGTGATPLLLGTENVTGIQSQAKGTDAVPDAIYKAMTSVREDGFAEPTVVFITPTKWQDVRLLRTSDGVYIWGHPSTPGPSTIWGVPVVETTAAPSAKALLGDYATHSALYLRRGVTVQVTNSHSTHFIEGKQAIRVDMRVAAVHFRPKAFAEVTGL